MARAQKRPAPPAPEFLNDIAAELPSIAKLDEVAKFLRVNVRTIRRLIDAGRLSALQGDPGRGSSRVLVPRRAVENYLSSIVR